MPYPGLMVWRRCFTRSARRLSGSAVDSHLPGSAHGQGSKGSYSAPESQFGAIADRALSLAPLPPCGLCSVPHFWYGDEGLGDHLRTANTSRFTFLLPPPALRSDGARRQLVHDRRHPLHDPFHQAAPRCLRGKVPTPTAGAWSRDAEDLTWSYRPRQLHQLVGDRLRRGQVRHFWRICRPADHTEDLRIRAMRLCTRAQNVAFGFHGASPDPAG
jgi:hypothetical protein